MWHQMGGAKVHQSNWRYWRTSGGSSPPVILQVPGGRPAGRVEEGTQEVLGHLLYRPGWEPSETAN